MLRFIIVLALTAHLLLLSTRAQQQPYSFITIGDWGGYDVSAQYASNVNAVAQQMVSTIASSNAQFVVNTGDNYYWCGTTGTGDSQFQADWVGPFASQMSLKWYSVMGNHDYAYSPQSQVDYSQINSQWVMPARYFTKRMLVDQASSTYASFIFLDTTPCIREYRDTNPDNWDPCGTKMPTCSFAATTDDFEGQCNLHGEVMKQDCSAQLTWLQQKLAAVPANDWLIIVGHHPLDEVNVADFKSALINKGFSIYLNGHTHTLTQYQIDGAGAYVTSGAGSMVDSDDQNSEASRRKLSNLPLPDDVEHDTNSFSGLLHRALSYWYPYPGGGGYYPYSGGGGASSTGVTKVWNQKIAGFTLSSFGPDFQSLTTQFISTSGQIVHSFTSTKSGTITKSNAYSSVYNSFLQTKETIRRTLYSSSPASSEDGEGDVEAFLA